MLDDELDLLEGEIITLETARLDAALLNSEGVLAPAAVQLTIAAVESSPLPCTPKLCDAPGAIAPFQSTLHAV